MAILILSFIAGVLTIAAPCILPLLPVIVGGSVVEPTKPTKDYTRPLIITGSLALSVVAFTLLLKVSTAFLGIPQMVWQAVSGGLVMLLGINFVWPGLYEQVSARSGFFTKASTALGGASRKNGFVGAMLIGLALGPVFSSCSPTYALIVAAVLPVSFATGLAYLAAYALGLALSLLLVTYVGQALVRRLGWLGNPKGIFRRIVGIVFIIVGLAVVVGFDKTIQAFVLEQGWYDPINHLEQSLQ